MGPQVAEIPELLNDASWLSALDASHSMSQPPDRHKPQVPKCFDNYLVDNHSCPIQRDVKRKTLLPARERRNIFGRPAPDHTADTSLFASARPSWPVAERPHKPRSDGPAILLPRWGFMFLMATPFGALKLTSLAWLQSCQPWSYWRLVATAFFG